MHSIVLGAVIGSLVVPGAILLAWQRHSRRQRAEALSPGRVVIAANLVATRRRN